MPILHATLLKQLKAIKIQLSNKIDRRSKSGEKEKYLCLNFTFGFNLLGGRRKMKRNPIICSVNHKGGNTPVL